MYGSSFWETAAATQNCGHTQGILSLTSESLRLLGVARGRCCGGTRGLGTRRRRKERDRSKGAAGQIEWRRGVSGGAGTRARAARDSDSERRRGVRRGRPGVTVSGGTAREGALAGRAISSFKLIQRSTVLSGPDNFPSHAPAWPGRLSARLYLQPLPVL